MTIAIKASLNGILVAEPTRLVFTATKGDGMKQKAAGRIEKEVLLTVSDPVAVQNIEAGGTSVLSLFDVDVIPNEIDPGKGVVRLGIDAADIPEEGVGKTSAEGN